MRWSAAPSPDDAPRLITLSKSERLRADPPSRLLRQRVYQEFSIVPRKPLL
jgi:hypothetical protein